MNSLWSAAFVTASPVIYGWRFLAYPVVKMFQCRRRVEKSSIRDQLSANHSNLGGYRAGNGHYANVWTRDSFFALFAPNSVEQKRQLANRLQRNMKMGVVPFTFHEMRYLPALLCGLRCKKKVATPSYFDEKLCQQVMDANSQYIILVHDVWAHLLSKDSNLALQWLAKHERSLFRAIQFYDRFRDPLIKEKPFANWEDSLMLHGVVPYTNVLWLEASKRFKMLRGRLEIPAYDLDYETRERQVFTFLNSCRNLDTVTAALLVIWFGDKPESRTQLLRLNKKYSAIPWGVPNRARLLSCNKVFIPLKIIGQGKYHNGWNWSWVALLWCLALVNAKFTQEARRIYGMFEKVVERDGTIYEVYDSNSMPIKRAFYSSEPRFSEGMGLFLRCKAELENIDDR